MNGDIYEGLQITNLVLSIIVTSFGILVACNKNFRDKLFRVKKRNDDRDETDRCLLRDRITSIYYEHLDDKGMKEFEFKNVERLYKQYKKIGGNSFVDKIWKEMQNWKIIV